MVKYKILFAKIRNKSRMSPLNPSVKQIKKFIQVGKKQVRSPSFTGGTMLYVENPKDSTTNY